jgi:hypothetical protein
MSDNFRISGYETGFIIRSEYDHDKDIWKSQAIITQAKFVDGEWVKREMSSIAFNSDIELATNLAVSDLTQKLRELSFDLFGDENEPNKINSSQNTEDRPIIL